MRVAFENDPTDRPFYSFINGVNNARSAAGGINRLNTKLHIDIVESVRSIDVDELFPALFQIFFLQRRVYFHANILSQFLRLASGCAIDLNFIEHRPRLYRLDHSYAVT